MGQRIHDLFTFTGELPLLMPLTPSPTSEDLLQAVDTAAALLDQQN